MASTSLVERAKSRVHKQLVTSLDVPYTGNSDILYSASRDKKVYQWKLNTSDMERIGTLIKGYAGHNHFITDVKANKTNEMIITASYDHTARIYDVNTQKYTILKGHKKDLTGVTINTEDNKIITGSCDGSIALWNTEGVLSKVLTPENPSSIPIWVNCVSFVPNSNLCVTGSSDGKLRIWDINSGKIIRTFVNGNDLEYYATNEVPVPEANMITALSVSADGSFCAYGGRDCVVYIINLSDAACLLHFETESPITSLAFAITEPIIAVGTRNSIICWDVIGNERSAVVENESKTIYCTALTWSKTRLVTGYNDGAIVVYDFVRNVSDN